MSLRIEDYAMIGDCESAALVGNDGSIDWLCFPRFDSDACFAALLGGPEHGRWSLAPAGEVTGASRRYRGDTLILETELETPRARCASSTSCRCARARAPIVRIVEGISGSVPMKMELVVRFDYGHMVPG
jgi:GH15 family glucan-1,4-alpha-glucosidase